MCTAIILYICRRTYIFITADPFKQPVLLPTKANENPFTGFSKAAGAVKGQKGKKMIDKMELVLKKQSEDFDFNIPFRERASLLLKIIQDKLKV